MLPLSDPQVRTLHALVVAWDNSAVERVDTGLSKAGQDTGPP